MARTRKAKTEDLAHIARILKQAFPVHNIFSRTEEEIKSFIESLHENAQTTGGGFIVAEHEAGGICGAMLAEKVDTAATHSRWNYKHTAIDPVHRGKGIGSELMQEAEKLVSADMKDGDTAKIELSVSGNEAGAVKFYVKHGFIKEGELSNHYRMRESAYVMGKTITR